MASITIPMSDLNMDDEKPQHCTCSLGFPCDLGSRMKCNDWDNRMKVADNVPPGIICKPTFIIDHKCDKMEGCGSCFFTHEHESFVEQIRDFILSNILHLFDNDVDNGEPIIYQYARRNTKWMCPIQIIGRNTVVADEFRTAVQSGFHIIGMDMWKYREWINNLSKTITNNLIVTIQTIFETSSIVFTSSQRTIPGPIIGGINGRHGPRHIHYGIFKLVSNYLKNMLVQEIHVCTVTTENSWKPSYWHRPGKPWRKEWFKKVKANTTTEEEEKEALICGACPKALFAMLPQQGECQEEVLLDTLDNKVYVDGDTGICWNQWTIENP